jgi:hypothetical protein
VYMKGIAPSPPIKKHCFGSAFLLAKREEFGHERPREGASRAPPEAEEAKANE